MYETYASHGIQFQYPASWEVQEQVGAHEIVITVSSPETSFWSVSLFLDHPEPENVIAVALDAFRDEYDELDIYDAAALLCGRPTVARNLEFFCLELLNSAWMRAFSTPDFTVLVLYQANDLELVVTESEFERISRSLKCVHASVDEGFHLPDDRH